MIKSPSISLVSERKTIKQSVSSIIHDIIQNKYLYILALPGIIFFVIFKYIPIGGVVIAFQDYSPYDGILKSEWVGFEHFARLFSNPDFFILFRNTLAISIFNLVLFFPLPIIISLMLNEIGSQTYKKMVQSVLYIPHFLSWVIVYALTVLFFAKGSGVFNQILVDMGFQKIDILTNPNVFWFVLALQTIWKETGWGTIVFLAAIAGLDVNMYEAARIDGAGRLQQIWYITLPSIANIVVVLLILRLGGIMDVGFEQIFLMNNGAVSEVANVFDLYAYRLGMKQGQLSFSTAIGVFKSVIGLILVVGSNKISKKLGQQGIY